jgi:uracil-DNA glycosylase
MFNKEDLLKGVKKSWIPLLNNSELDKIIETLNSKNNSIILPTEDRIFQAFKYFELKDTKIILLGQDPYISCEQAMGLSFSVPKGCPLPPSLRNIYKELGIENIKNGDLTPWVKNNQLLLLNTSLTVFEGKSNSHHDIWSDYTNRLIKDISDKTDHIIFLLLGNNAQSKSKFIDTKKHIIIKGVHPSPLSAYRGFFGSGIFDKLDDEYEKLFNKEIKWDL